MLKPILSKIAFTSSALSVSLISLWTNAPYVKAKSSAEILGFFAKIFSPCFAWIVYYFDIYLIM